MTVRFRLLMAILLAVIAFCLSSLVLYSQSGKSAYASPQDVPADFPIAVLDNTGPALIDWQTYTRESTKYRDHLIANAAPGVFALADGRQFELKPLSKGQLELEVRTGLLRARANYVVEMGNVRPISLRVLDSKNLLWSTLAALAFGLSFFALSRRRT